MSLHAKKFSSAIKALCVFFAGAFFAYGVAPAHAAVPAIPFTVTMSESVNVTGTPRLVLDVGGTTRYAVYSAGTGTAALTFTYTATAGDIDLDGIGIAATTLDLNGGTVTDLNGNALSNLTFTAPANMASVFVNYPSLSIDFIYDTDGRYTLNGTVYNDLTSFLAATSGTFSRASVGTYYDSSGILQTAASSAPRFDHDPSTLAAKGILIEESRTNLLIRSAEFDNVIWQKDNSGTTANAATAPDGTFSADKMLDDSNTTRHDLVGFYGSASPSQYYTFSVYLKPAELTYAMIQVSDYATGDFRAVFDLTGKTLVSQLVYGDWLNETVSIHDAGNGWARCVITGQKSVAGNNTANVVISTHDGSSESYTGDGLSGIYVWGAQLEQGAFPTSYIPTTAATVTRSADSLVIPTAGWFNSSTGAFAYSWNKFGSNNGIVLETKDATSSTANRFNTFSGAQKARVQIVPGVTVQDTGGTHVPFVANATTKAAFTYTSGNSASSVDNSSPLASAVSFTSPSYTKLNLGMTDNTIYGSPATTILNGYLRYVKFYPLRIGNTQLQILTQ